MRGSKLFSQIALCGMVAASVLAMSPQVQALQCMDAFRPPTPHQAFLSISQHMNANVLGQDANIRKVLAALFVGGHVLLEGPTGVAKTRMANVMGATFQAKVKKEQFTPDTAPSELKGIVVLNPETKESDFKPGALFANFFVADEINRTLPKIQSALLSAMEEGYVLVDGIERPLPEVFFVLATQNPDTHVGTYPLPEAQLDRFLFKLVMDMPTDEIEKEIVKLLRRERRGETAGAESSGPRATLKTILQARKQIAHVDVPDSVLDYMVELIAATRRTSTYPGLRNVAEYVRGSGVGPRGTAGLERAAQAIAWMAGRNEVRIEDVDFIAADVLRHRLWLVEDAADDGVTADKVINEIIKAVHAKLRI